MVVAHKLLGGIWELLSLLSAVLRHYETVSSPSSGGVTDRLLANKHSCLGENDLLYVCDNLCLPVRHVYLKLIPLQIRTELLSSGHLIS